MTMLKTLTLAAVTAIAIATLNTAPADAAAGYNGPGTQGVSFNGAPGNGSSLQGITRNGLAGNGASFQGVSPNSAGAQGTSYNGAAALDGCVVDIEFPTPAAR
jgi:hypothetical protein